MSTLIYSRNVMVRCCGWCKQMFQIDRTEVKRGRGKYCSKSCQKEHNSGHDTKSINQRFIEKRMRRREQYVAKLEEQLEGEEV